LRSVRRVLKRLGRKQRNRTRTFAQQTAKQLVEWAPKGAVLVFEDLHMPQPLGMWASRLLTLAVIDIVCLEMLQVQKGSRRLQLS